MSRKKTAKNMKTGVFLTRVLIILLIGSLLLTLGSVFTFRAEGKRIGDDYENMYLIGGDDYEKTRPVGPITVVELPIKPPPSPYPYPQPSDNSPPVFNGIKYANVTGETLTLTWGAAYDLSPDLSLPITYNIYQATICSGQNFSTPTYTTQNLSIQVPCSGEGITYYYVVRAEDSVGNEDNNTVECAYTKTVTDYIIYIKEEIIEPGYNNTIWGDIYLLDIGKITVEDLKIDAYNNILTYGTISITELNIGGYIVNVSGIFDDKGVLLNGNLTLPGTVGGGIVGVKDLRITYDGKFSGVVYTSNLNINNYVVNIEKGVFNNTGLIFNGSLTLPATVGGGTITVENLNICSDGNFSATISISNLDISGYIVNVDQVTFDNKGLLLTGSFTLPASIGGATVTVSNLKIRSDGTFSGSVKLASFVIDGFTVNALSTSFDNEGLIVNGEFTLPQSVGGGKATLSALKLSANGTFAGSVTITNFVANGYAINIDSANFDNTGVTIDGSLTLPSSSSAGGATVSVKGLNINSGGQYSGIVSISNLVVDGYTLNILTVTFDNNGLVVSGSVTLPASVGGAAVSVSNLKIESCGEFSGTVSITSFKIDGYIVNIDYVSFNNTGLIATGSLTLPSSVGGGTIGVKDLKIDANGQFSGTAYITSMTINGYVATVNSVVFNNTGLTVTGSLTLPSSVGGGTIGVNDLKIDANGQFSGTVTITSLAIHGYTVNVAKVTFNNTGLIASVSLTLPSSVGGATVSVTDLKIDANGQFSGTVAITSLTINSYTVNVAKVTFNNTGLIISVSLTLPSSVGGGTVSVTDLKIDANGQFSGTVTIISLTINGYTVNVLKVTFNNTGLIASGSLTLPTSVGGATVSVTDLKIDASGQFSGTVIVTNLAINGYTVNVVKVTFNNTGLIASGSLTLPAAVGGATVTVKDLQISSNGNYSGSVSITNLNINGYIVDVLTVSFDNKGLIIDGSFTLPTSVGGAIISASNLVISSNGDYSGTVSITNLNIGGYVVNVDGVTFDSKGLIVSGSVTLPASVGGGTFSVKDLMINSNGDYSGSVSITNLNISGYIINVLTVSFDNKGLTVDGSLTLPTSVGGATVSVSSLVISSNGDFSGTVSITNLDINGYVVTIASVTFDNKGLIISASLTLPASVGGATVSVSNLAISSNGDYSGTVSITNLDIKGYIVNIDSITFDNKGLIVSGSLTLPAEVGGATISVKDLKINSTGATVGSISISSLNVGGYLVSISVSGFQEGIVTVSGSLGLPTSVGGTAVTVKELRIDSKGITFSVIEVYADLDIKGIKVYVNTAKITSDGVTIDTASVTVPPIGSVNIGGGITVNNLIIKSNGDVDGSISGLSMEVAGFGFGVNNVKLIKDGIYVESASFKLQPYGVSASVTEFTFNSSGISLKSCSVTVPTFEVAGYTLSGMSASFGYTPTGWRLYADATLGIPNWYCIEVNCTIESGGLKAFGLKVPGASIPLGSTPLILKDPGFFFDLTYYPTVTCEFYGTIAPVTDCALVNTVEADLTLRITTDGTIAGTSITGIGVLTVVGFPVADATVTINNTGIYGEGNVDIATIITGHGYFAILYNGNITIYGESSIQVLTYTFMESSFDLANDHFVCNATVDIPIKGTIAGIYFDLSQHLDVGFGIYAATATTEAHATGHLNLESHFKIEPLVDYGFSVNANLYINSSVVWIYDNHLSLKWNYGALIPEIKWSISDNPEAISVVDSYWTDSYGNKITRAYPGDSVTAHLVFVANDGGAPGIKAFGRPVNVRLVRDISNLGDAVVIETNIDGWFIVGGQTEITLGLTVETTGVDWVGEWYDLSYDRGYFVESSWSGNWEFWGLFYWPEFKQDGYPPRLDIGVDDATGTWESSPPPAPTLSSPANGATGISTTPTLICNSVTDPDGDSVWYYFIVDDNTDWSSPATQGYAGGAGDRNYVVGTDGDAKTLLAGTTYYWCVIAYDGKVFGNWSSVWSFVVSAQNDAGSGGDAGNSLAGATLITPGSYSGYLDNIDTNDYYKFNINSGNIIAISMTSPTGADFDLQLLNPSGTVKASSTSTGTDSISFTADSSGYWVIRIYVYSGSGTYTFSLSVTTTTTIFYEGFEGAWPGSWSLADTDSNNGEDYWGDSSYRAYAGSWSGWCADIGSKSSTVTDTIFYENFEGVWPGSWFVGDSDTNSGSDYWGDNSYRAYAGSWSGYCADEGDTGASHLYDNNMYAYMYRSVSLSGYGSATLTFYLWLNSESGYDYFKVIYYTGSSWVDLYSKGGNTNGWIYVSVNVPTTATAVGFLFDSDSSVTYEGAYIDEVTFTATKTVDTPNTNTHTYDNNMYASMYRTVDLSGYSSAKLQFYLWLDSESNYDYFYAGYYDTSWHWVYSRTGNTGGWVYVSIDIPTTATAVGFLFDSDASVYSYEGAYIDEVVLKATKTISAKSIGPGDSILCNIRFRREISTDIISVAEYTVTIGRYMLESRTEFPSQGDTSNPDGSNLLVSSCIKNNNLLSAGNGGIEKIACKT